MKDFFPQFEKCRSRLFGVIKYKTGSHHDAQDIIQNVALAGYRRYDGYKGGDFWNWLSMVARTEITTYYRKQRRQRLNECHFEDVDEDFRTGDRYTEPGFEQVENMTIVDKAKKIGGPKFAEIVDLRLNEDLTSEETAERLNTTYAGIQSHVTRTYREIRVVMEGVAA